MRLKGMRFWRIMDHRCRKGAVTLLGVWVSDGASGRGGVRFGAGAQIVMGWSAAPVMWFQTAKRTVISAR